MLELKENIKREIDTLNDQQLRIIAEMISLWKDKSSSMAFWQKATPQERAKELQQWVKQLSPTNISLSDEAFHRVNIYE